MLRPDASIALSLYFRGWLSELFLATVSSRANYVLDGKILPNMTIGDVC